MTNQTESKTRQRFDDNAVQTLRQALKTGQEKSEPKRNSRNMRDLMCALRGEIVELRDRGYTVAEIAEMVFHGGFNQLKPSTLRRYVSTVSARKRRRKRSVEPKRVRASTPPPQAPSSPTQSPGIPTRSAEFAVIPDHEDL